MSLFPPFEDWLERHKWGPLPEGMRPTFREGYRRGLHDQAAALRAGGMEKAALVVEQGIARMDAEWPPLPDVVSPHSQCDG